MLTNKQKWRMQSTLYRAGSDITSNEFGKSEADKVPDIPIKDIKEITSLDKIENDSLHDATILKENCLLLLNNKFIKKLKFNLIVKVVLIPSIQEYRNAGLDSYLWCSDYELKCYRLDAIQELHEYIHNHPHEISIASGGRTDYKAIFKLMLNKPIYSNDNEINNDTVTDDSDGNVNMDYISYTTSESNMSEVGLINRNEEIDNNYSSSYTKISHNNINVNINNIYRTNKSNSMMDIYATSNKIFNNNLHND